MTLPEFIIIGLICFLLLIQQLKKENATWYFILLFVSVFPVFYIIIKESNVYGGWRHVSFVFPGLAILAAMGVNTLISQFQNKYIQIGVATIFGILAFLPLRHTIVNHPHQYIYYNSISGGVKKAYSKYEMDYFYHTLRAGSEWLMKNKIENTEVPPGKKIIIASNYSTPVNYYFRHHKEKVQIVYIRYYERGNSDWDFAIIANSYINPYQMKKRIWPPSNTIHTIDVDKKPACAILERKNRYDLEGYRLMSAGNPAEAVNYFRKAVEEDPKYEMAYYNMAQAYMNIRNYDEALKAIRQCLKYYPDYNRGLNLMGMAYLNKNNFENALQVFTRNMKLNPKYVASYYYAGLIYAQNNDLKTAEKYLIEAIEVNGRYKPAYLLLAQIYQATGNEAKAREFTARANALR
jgi:tetratricopeptide (TPR) repeat protein